MYFKGLNKRIGNTNLSHTLLHILHTVQYNCREELLNKYYKQSRSISHLGSRTQLITMTDESEADGYK